MVDASAPPTRCAICDALEPDATLLSDCFDCGAWFHLNPYSNRPGVDCGDAMLGDTLGVHFYCQRCIEVREAVFADDDPRTRAEAMIAALHGDALGMPPPSPRTPAPPSPGAPPMAGRAPRARRRYRRIDRP